MTGARLDLRLIALEAKVAWRSVGPVLSVACAAWLFIAMVGEPKFLTFYRLSFTTNGLWAVVWASHAILALAWASEQLKSPRLPSRFSSRSTQSAQTALMLLGLILSIALWTCTLPFFGAAWAASPWRTPTFSFLSTLPVSFLFPPITATAGNQLAIVLLLGSLLLANQAAAALCTTDPRQGMTSIGPILLALLGSVLLVARRPHR